MVQLKVPHGMKLLQLKRLLARKKNLGIPMAKQVLVCVDEEMELPLDDNAQELAYYSLAQAARVRVSRL